MNCPALVADGVLPRDCSYFTAHALGQNLGELGFEHVVTKGSLDNEYLDLGTVTNVSVS